MLANPALSKFLETYGIIVVVLAMVGFLTWTQPEYFLSLANLTNIVKQNASATLLALGMFVVIVTAGIDLSVGSIMALAMVCLAIADKRLGLPWPVVILIGPLIGIACGFVNGIGLTWLRLPHPFIMTLGMLNIARGLTNLVTNAAPVSGLQPEVRYLGQKNFDFGIFEPPSGLPASLFVVALAAVVLWFFLSHTNIGRHIYAIGGNPQAARVSGINVDRVLIYVYTICGFFAGPCRAAACRTNRFRVSQRRHRRRARCDCRGHHRRRLILRRTGQRSGRARRRHHHRFVAQRPQSQ